MVKEDSEPVEEFPKKYHTKTKEDFDEWIRDKLGKSALLRHLFARLHKEVILEMTNGLKVRGELKSIDLVNHIFEVDAKGNPDNRTYFLWWNQVVYLSSESYKFDT